jgi:outer membrane protein assembly factor BamE (lipoprotein component of BamABCDE complex)
MSMTIAHRMHSLHRVFRSRRAAGTRAVGVVLAAGLLLSGCLFTQVQHRGYVLPDGALEQIPLGATQDQVLIVLGTPSTVATVSGEVFYYISQRAERAALFMPLDVKDQRVIAVYFDRSRRVERLANYGLKDGRVFDYVSRTTPAGGSDYNYITYMLKIVGRG